VLVSFSPAFALAASWSSSSTFFVTTGNLNTGAFIHTSTGTSGSLCAVFYTGDSSQSITAISRYGATTESGTRVAHTAYANYAGISGLYGFSDLYTFANDGGDGQVQATSSEPVDQVASSNSGGGMVCGPTSGFVASDGSASFASAASSGSVDFNLAHTNDYVLALVRTPSGTTITAGSNATQVYTSAGNNRKIYDSSGATMPGGAFSMAWNVSGATSTIAAAVAFTTSSSGSPDTSGGMPSIGLSGTSTTQGNTLVAASGVVGNVWDSYWPFIVFGPGIFLAFLFIQFVLSLITGNGVDIETGDH